MPQHQMLLLAKRERRSGSNFDCLANDLGLSFNPAYVLASNAIFLLPGHNLIGGYFCKL